MLPRRTCSASVKAAPLLLTTTSSTKDTATIYPRCFSLLFYITALILSLLTYDHLRLNFSHGGLILDPGDAAILEEPYKFQFKATFLTPGRAEPDYLRLNSNISLWYRAGITCSTQSSCSCMWSRPRSQGCWGEYRRHRSDPGKRNVP